MEAATRTQQVITLTTTLTSLLIIWVELLIGMLFNNASNIPITLRYNDSSKYDITKNYMEIYLHFQVWSIFSGAFVHRYSN